MIYKCEARKSFSDQWVLTKVLNNEKEFTDFEVFDGDFLYDNFDDQQLSEINDSCECIQFDAWQLEDGDVAIDNITEIKAK